MRVGRVDSRFTGSLLRRGADDFAGFGLSGMIFLAVAEMSVRMARFAAMFSRRLRSKALISAGSFLTGIVAMCIAASNYSSLCFFGGVC